MSVNVGLETSSAAAAPSPSTIPRASVVFPAPRLPIRSTSALLGMRRASERPSATVSSSLDVRKFTHRLGKKSQEVRGDQRLFADLACADFPSAPVKPDCRNGGSIHVFRKLSDHARDHS